MLQAQIFVGTDQLKDESPLYEFIFQFLVNEKVQGATLLRGRAGYDGKHLNRPNDLFSFDETPMIITFVDEDDKVRSTLTKLRQQVKSGFIITSQVEKWN